MPCTNAFVLVGILLVIAAIAFGLAWLASRWNRTFGRFVATLLIFGLGGSALLVSPLFYLVLVYSFDPGSSFCTKSLLTALEYYAPPRDHFGLSMASLSVVVARR
jgi:hypothetical protein